MLEYLCVLFNLLNMTRNSEYHLNSCRTGATTAYDESKFQCGVNDFL